MIERNCFYCENMILMDDKCPNGWELCFYCRLDYKKHDSICNKYNERLNPDKMLEILNKMTAEDFQKSVNDMTFNISISNYDITAIKNKLK